MVEEAERKLEEYEEDDEEAEDLVVRLEVSRLECG
jgi:hypothetical protein